MKIARFDLEFWLNPLDSVAKYNFGSSCCKPVTVSEMLELTGADPIFTISSVTEEGMEPLLAFLAT